MAALLFVASKALESHGHPPPINATSLRVCVNKTAVVEFNLPGKLAVKAWAAGDGVSLSYPPEASGVFYLRIKAARPGEYEVLVYVVGGEGALRAKTFQIKVTAVNCPS